MTRALISDDLREKIINYYVDAGLDYAFWSKGLNMHFGYGAITSFLMREKMLNRMTHEVLSRLDLDDTSGSIADFGCGVGASMRKALESYPGLNITGFTIVPWQKQKGDDIHRAAGCIDRLEIKVEDYHKTTLQSDSTDGVYAIESACYSPKHLQCDFFREIHRVLKPEGRMVVADGFLKVPEDALNPCARKIYKGICSNWALPGMMNTAMVQKNLEEIGFKNIMWEDVSWRVAPSVAHVPFVILKFLICSCLRRKSISTQSINNLMGSFQTLVLGLHRYNFSYYLLSATK